jgi:hypothetical protein
MSKSEQPLFPQNFVSNILNHKIYLENMEDQSITAVKKIGAFQDKIAGRPVWLINYAGDDELAKKLHELNEIGFLFVGEPAGWPPAAIFDHLREKKLLNDNFKEVTWHRPGNWVIRER